MIGIRAFSRRIRELDMPAIAQTALGEAGARLGDAARARAGADIAVTSDVMPNGLQLTARGAGVGARMYGTSAAPPRPVFAPAASLAPEITAAIADAIARALMAA